MLRDLNDRLKAGESSKLPIEIPAHFAADLAARFVAMPSMNVEPVSGTLTLQGKPYAYYLSTEDIFTLTRQHEQWQSDEENKVGGILEMIVSGAGEAYTLLFDPSDLGWVFFTIDKVISGADSVPITGFIIAELEVPAEL